MQERFYQLQPTPSPFSFVFIHLYCLAAKDEAFYLHSEVWSYVTIMSFVSPRGWSGGAMVLGKLPVPGRPTYMSWSRARAYCACSRCGWRLFGHFFLSSIISLFFLPLFGRRPDRYRLKYCLKGPLNPKTTNQPMYLRGAI